MKTLYDYLPSEWASDSSDKLIPQKLSLRSDINACKAQVRASHHTPRICRGKSRQACRSGLPRMLSGLALCGRHCMLLLYI